MIYVISDTPKLKNSFIRNPSCFELRSVVLTSRKMVITSDTRNILEYVKHKDDNFIITPISPVLLSQYCRCHNKGVIHVSKCFCDIASRKEICKMDEYHLEGAGAVGLPSFLFK